MYSKSETAEDKLAVRILIADDNASDRKALQHVIDQSGLNSTYVEVSTLEEAMDACIAHEFDCAFVDQMMPNGSGKDAIRNLTKSSPWMPIILITSSGGERVAVDALHQGAVDYFRKSELSSAAVRRGIEDALSMMALRRSAVEHIKELEDFASVLAHDLNAPVASLQLFARTLEQDLADTSTDRGTLIEMCREVVDAGVRTASLVDSLHRYTRPGSRLDYSTVDMNSVFEDAKKNLEYKIRNRGAVVTRDDLPAVAGSAPLLVELLQNLFSNGIKYCEDNPPRIHVSARPAADSDWLTFVVADNGIGIPPDKAELIFEPLKRLHTMAKAEGSGLGLAICRKIVERHGGTIQASASDSGNGASFEVTLAKARDEKPAEEKAPAVTSESHLSPQEDAPEPSESNFADETLMQTAPLERVVGNTPAEALGALTKDIVSREDEAKLLSVLDSIPVSGWSEYPSARSSEGAPKLLIADDDPGILRFLTHRCQMMGFEVRDARNGLHALALAKQFRPDVLILDVNMPEADGLTVLARLLLPGNRPMEAIVITASSYEETARRCESLGAVHVRKGVDLFKDVRSALLTIFPELDRANADGMEKSHAAGHRLHPRVLIVGDDSVLAKFLRTRLEKYDIETVAAADGMEGFSKAIVETPSLVITQYEMKNGDARYLLGKLRSTPETARVPLFVVSDKDVDEVAKSRMQYDSGNSTGEVQFFTQPIDADSFFTELGKYCALSANPNPPDISSPPLDSKE